MAPPRHRELPRPQKHPAPRNRRRRRVVGFDGVELADAKETGLVLYAAVVSYDRQMGDEERKLLDAQLERYGERVMSDKNAAAMATVLMAVAEKAAAMVPSQSQSEGDAPPLVEIGAEGREEKGPEVMVE